MLTHKKIFRKTMIILLTAFALPVVIGLLYVTIQGQATEVQTVTETDLHKEQYTLQEQQSEQQVEIQSELHKELHTQQTQHITKQAKDKAVNFLSTTNDTNVTHDKNDVYDTNDEHNTASSMTVDKLTAAYENPEPQPVNWDNARKHFMAGCFIITIVFSLTSIIISTCTLIRRKYYEHKKKTEYYNKDRR